MLDRLRREIDVKLLRTLHLLITESSVSRVAALQGQSQPAVSATLKRLRRITGDPLLAPAAGGRLTPTDRGREIAAIAARILADFDRLFEPPGAFDPRAVRRQARIVASNCLGVLMLPRIVELVRREAPHIELDLCARPGEDESLLRRRLEAGEIDVVIGNWPSPLASLRFAPLFDTDIVCMMRPAHPLARATAMPLDLYLAQEHLSPTPHAGALFSPIDGRLAQLGVARRIAVSVPEYALAPYVLSRDDLIFTTGRPFADHFASLTPLSVTPAPPELGRMNFYMLWHERAHHSPFEQWLRGQIRAVAGELAAIGAVERGGRHNAPLMPAITSRGMAHAHGGASTRP